jgi:hypothetical protein
MAVVTTKTVRHEDLVCCFKKLGVLKKALRIDVNSEDVIALAVASEIAFIFLPKRLLDLWNKQRGSFMLRPG